MPALRKITAIDAHPDPDGRPPEAFVRFSRRRDRGHGRRLEMTIGRALWYRLGKPDRVQVEQQGERVRILPTNDGSGKKLHVTNSSPRTWAPSTISVAPGRYKATIRYGAIVLGECEQLDEDVAEPNEESPLADAPGE